MALTCDGTSDRYRRCPCGCGRWQVAVPVTGTYTVADGLVYAEEDVWISKPGAADAAAGTGTTTSSERTTTSGGGK